MSFLFNILSSIQHLCLPFLNCASFTTIYFKLFNFRVYESLSLCMCLRILPKYFCVFCHSPNVCTTGVAFLFHHPSVCSP
ncbi:hypothetical protein F4779DRAFT_327570 [Xylariaceae sp. FL0662B]|nr:hypothetical protein F4779DRAFT_327570 [Xylariaceae sp. FL0662B]